MKRILFLIPLLLLFIPALPIDTQAQTWPVLEPVTLTGGAAIDGTGKDTLYTTAEVIDTKLLDSLHLFFESGDSSNSRLLLAPVHIALDAQSEADLVKDTVHVKSWATTKAATKGVTWQEIVQAFGGAVPPKFKPYLWVDRDKTGKATDGKKIGLAAKEFEKK